MFEKDTGKQEAKIDLKISTCDEAGDNIENITLEKDSLLEFIKKILEVKKKLTGDVNSNKSIMTIINLNNVPIVVIDEISFRPVYTF